MRKIVSVFPAVFFQFSKSKSFPALQNTKVWMLMLWFVCSVCSVLAQETVRIENVWKKTNLNNETGSLSLGPVQPGWNSAMWTIEKVTGTSYVRIKNVWKGTYLNNETGELSLGSIQPGWNSAMWVLEPIQGTNNVRIKNVWKGTYLNNETGQLSLGSIQPGWNSAMWKILKLDGTPLTGTTASAPLPAATSQPASSAGFYMIFASDPQWPWTAKTDNSETQSQSDKEKEATTLNENHVACMNSLANSLGSVKGVIINGDLTAFGHAGELEKFKSIYSKVKVPLYLGLGNHDYANNVDDCYENVCANNMVEYMIDHIKSKGAVNADYKQSTAYQFPNIETTITGSLSYSWDIGNVHFIQLHNYPVYQRQWSNYVSVGAAKRKTVKITTALNWLAADLAKARQAGKIIILNFHDTDEHWGDFAKQGELATFSNQFKDILIRYNVAAVFAGHYHDKVGRHDYARRALPDYASTPVFYCGSASQSHFLLVNFNGDKMTVEKISTLNGKVSESSKEEFTVFNKAVAVPIPKEDGWVTFFNEGGYVARYTLTYRLNGQTKTFSTGKLALGNKKRFEIPGSATNITLKGEADAVFNWKEIFNKTFNSAPNQCFKSYGTTISPKWNNNCE